MIPSETPRCWHSIHLDKSYENHNFLLENSTEVLKTVRSLNLSSEIKNLLLAMDWSKKKVLIVDQVFFNEKIGLESIDTIQSVVHLISYRNPLTLPVSQLPRFDGKYPKECLIIPLPQEFSISSIKILKKTISIPNIADFHEITELTRKKFSEFFEIMDNHQDVVKSLAKVSKERRIQAKKNPISRGYLPSSKENKFITAICAFEKAVQGQQIA